MSSVLGVAEYAGKKLEDAIDGVLVFRMPLTSGNSFFPEGIVGLLERREVGGDGLLVAFDRGDAVDDRVDVHEVTRRDVGEGTGGVAGGIVDIHSGVVGLAVGGLFLALDKTEEVGLAAVEVRVFKMPWFGIGVALQDTLLQMRNFVKPVHVQLAHERRKLLVLEPASEDLARELFMVENWMFGFMNG